jgi:LPPG:FO 2-phospho-L-lactate transferase
VLALSGGVGGAKLLLGLQYALGPRALAALVNTGDDFEHLGLAISPDVDTALYTLAGLVDPEQGWGRSAESWQFMAEIERLGGPTWFRLGDRDVALHVERTRRLRTGETLGSITQDVAVRFGIASHVWPMSDDPVRTVVETEEGDLPFQDYFVRRRCEPRVRALRYEGAHTARPAARALTLLDSAELECVLVGPSNPWLSIDPMLAIPALARALRETRAPVVAVSPLIGGQAVKGPTAKIMRELGLVASAPVIARHYAGLIDGFVLDEADAALAAEIEVPGHVTRTLMVTLEDRVRLARETLTFAQSLAGEARDRLRT